MPGLPGSGGSRFGSHNVISGTNVTHIVWLFSARRNLLYRVSLLARGQTSGKVLSRLQGALLWLDQAKPAALQVNRNALDYAEDWM